MKDAVKRFLYLNQDSLFSCYSQIAGGLPTQSTETSSDNHSGSQEVNGKVSGGVEVEAKIFGKGVEANVTPSLSGTSAILHTQDYQKSVEMRFHDDLFNKLELHLEKSGTVDAKNKKIGDFVKFTGKIDIVDMDYYRSLFGNKDFLKYIKQMEVENKATANINNTEKKQIEKRINKEYDNISNTMKLLCDIIPYKKFAVIGDAIIVIEDKYIRDNPGTMSYKYGGEMTVLGYITNLVSNSLQNTEDSLSALSSAMNIILLSLLNKKEIKIIHAIGIYY